MQNILGAEQNLDGFIKGEVQFVALHQDIVLAKGVAGM